MTNNIFNPKASTPYLDKVTGALTDLADKQLNNPFNPEDVSWKPTNVKGNTCLALAYADKRAYEDRLDEVFGPHNWAVQIKSYSSPYKKITKAKHKVWNDPTSEVLVPEQTIDAHNVYAIARIYVNGMGFKESTGVSETDDDNSITTAEAQAFKRACSMLGIGKYFYFLPKINCNYSFGKITDPPTLPDWAVPVTYCEECTEPIRTTQFKDKNSVVQSWGPQEIIKRSKQHFGKPLCLECMRKNRELGADSVVDQRLKESSKEEVEALTS